MDNLGHTPTPRERIQAYMEGYNMTEEEAIKAICEYDAALECLKKYSKAKETP